MYLNFLEKGKPTLRLILEEPLPTFKCRPNLGQIHDFVKAQGDNLRYAYAQPDPQQSLDTVAGNFETLASGCDQVRQNLYYLTVRQRVASSQALPDPEMYQAGLLILGQVQQLQLSLNGLYIDMTAVQNIANENKWANDKNFNYRVSSLMNSIVRIQDAVFTIYNAGYELTMRCR